ncbi:major facilitator superfamily domain-containing protein [Lipomyces tetrasporus]
MYGRKHVIIISNFLFTCLNMGCSEATSVAMLLLFRALSGVLGCAGLVVGVGIISDMYLPQETGRATSLFLLGPIIWAASRRIYLRTCGLAVDIPNDRVSRWCYGVPLLFFVKETNPAILLRRKAGRVATSMKTPGLVSVIDAHQQAIPPGRKLTIGLARAAKILCSSPVVFALSIYMLIVFSYIYVFFTIITAVLTTKYGWSVELA